MNQKKKGFMHWAVHNGMAFLLGRFGDLIFKEGKLI